MCIDVDSKEVFRFRNIHENAELLSNFLQTCKLIIGHNLLSFDLGVLNYFGIKLRDDVKFIDTLVVSRLLNYAQAGGHSLEAWGNHFGVPKSLFSDFSKWSQELEDRCVIDTQLTVKLYEYFKRFIEDPTWFKAITLEQDTVVLCEKLKQNGFYFDIDKSLLLEKEIRSKVETLEKELDEAFPPRPSLIKEVTPVPTKAGGLHAKDFRWLDTNDLTPFSAGSPFSLFEMVSFNPRSATQRIDVLWKAGWKPTEKTKGHIEAERSGDKEKLKKFAVYGWKTSEENLATLPDTAPEAAKKLKDFLLLSSRLEDLVEWNALYNKDTHRIHGTFNGLGSWTHRKSHAKPNMANIPSLTNRHGQPQPYGREFRSLWCAPKGRVLVGCDADGIQLRLFAHFTEDERLIASIVSGKKEDGTDIHSLNKQVLNTTYSNRELCASREVAKTYIYAVLLGAATGKQSEILSCNFSEATAGFSNLLKFYPGWKELKETKLVQDAKRGYFIGLDGRKVMFPSAHHILAGYLQNGESTVMKLACRIWNARLTREKIPYLHVDDVHDEWQTETRIEYSDYVGKVQADSIREAGEELKLFCPLAGSPSVGLNWAETH